VIKPGWVIRQEGLRLYNPVPEHAASGEKNFVEAKSSGGRF